VCITASPTQWSASADHDDPQFRVTTSFEGGYYHVHLAGELDIATRDMVHRACVASEHHDVAVELEQTTFMDCSGYGGLVAARLELERRGGSLTLRNSIGQPASLLALLAVSEGSVATL
jgi:anti-anti-sigma factor